MTNNYDFEAAKKLIDDDTNVTETNPLKDLLQICVKLVLVLFSIYLGTFAISGIIIKSLPLQKQIQMENFLSQMIDTKTINATQDDERCNKIKEKIKNVDKNFPATSNLNIYIISDKEKNALCYPNGNIYITSELYKNLDDNMLTFVIAHEIAHYKYKDHLMKLRKNISSALVLIFMSVVSPNNQMTNIIDGTISLADLKYSRQVETKADIYASKILMNLYGNVDGGIKTLQVLKSHDTINPEVFSTHPDLNKRIKKIKRIAN